MEDAATAEISRAQVWQWIHHGATLDDGTALTVERFRRMLDEEMERIRARSAPTRFARGRFDEARDALRAALAPPTTSRSS